MRYLPLILWSFFTALLVLLIVRHWRWWKKKMEECTDIIEISPALDYFIWGIIDISFLAFSGLVAAYDSWLVPGIIFAVCAGAFSPLFIYRWYTRCRVDESGFWKRRNFRMRHYPFENLLIDSTFSGLNILDRNGKRIGTIPSYFENVTFVIDAYTRYFQNRGMEIPETHGRVINSDDHFLYFSITFSVLALVIFYFPFKYIIVENIPWDDGTIITLFVLGSIYFSLSLFLVQAFYCYRIEIKEDTFTIRHIFPIRKTYPLSELDVYHVGGYFKIRNTRTSHFLTVFSMFASNNYMILDEPAIRKIMNPYYLRLAQRLVRERKEFTFQVGPKYYSVSPTEKEILVSSQEKKNPFSGTAPDCFSLFQMLGIDEKNKDTLYLKITDYLDGQRKGNRFWVRK
jgi:hypothetical protein